MRRETEVNTEKVKSKKNVCPKTQKLEQKKTKKQTNKNVPQQVALLTQHSHFHHGGGRP
jgi:hypothetical protein